MPSSISCSGSFSTSPPRELRTSSTSSFTAAREKAWREWRRPSCRKGRSETSTPWRQNWESCGGRLKRMYRSWDEEEAEWPDIRVDEHIEAVWAILESGFAE